ncbi:alpha-ketoglutarate-dependent dioxygenase AlkB family protein [Dyella sp.]|uniref:alpha-ketoglutarate-dependent dioxygenase AlkB family protein n=1 Tax=Dyella sp. TaxID=1869338 RepID=UPI003F80260E
MNDLFAKATTFESVDLPDADVRLNRSFLDQPFAAECFSALVEQVAWRQEKVNVWGQWHDQPRLVAWYGDPGATYSYSGSKLVPKPWTPLLMDLRAKIQSEVEVNFNSVLLNYYRDGNDRMGWHSDDEPDLGVDPTIASLSLGDTRTFLLKHKIKKSLGLKRIPLHSGSLIIMAGATQRFWLHAINRESGPSTGRVNLTFRWINRR